MYKEREYGLGDSNRKDLEKGERLDKRNRKEKGRNREERKRRMKQCVDKIKGIKKGGEIKAEQRKRG